MNASRPSPAPVGPTPSNWCWRSGAVAPGPTVVFDIDGVLSDAAGRQHFLERGRRDWTAFFEACGDDPVIEEIARLAGHANTRTTEVVYRRELRPVLTTGAEAMDKLFGDASGGRRAVRQRG